MAWVVNGGNWVALAKLPEAHPSAFRLVKLFWIQTLAILDNFDLEFTAMFDELLDRILNKLQELCPRLTSKASWVERKPAPLRSVRARPVTFFAGPEHGKPMLREKTRFP